MQKTWLISNPIKGLLPFINYDPPATLRSTFYNCEKILHAIANFVASVVTNFYFNFVFLNYGMLINIFIQTHVSFIFKCLGFFTFYFYILHI